MMAAPGALYAYYRMQLPLLELAKHDGYEVTYFDAGDDGHPNSVTLRVLEGHDLVVAQRWNKHDGLGVWRGAALRSKTVYELDDDIWHIGPENWQAYNMFGRPDVRDAIEFAAGTADLVTVTTEPLAGVIREYTGARNVAVLPNRIPRLATELPRERRERPRVGWMGGASHGVDIGLVARPVRRFLRLFPGWDVQLNGTDYRPTIKAAGIRMFYVPWVQVNTNPRKYFAKINFDIGLCPIFETSFARSKSAIKAIEYGARGIPVIASDCEAYRGVITHGVNGFLVRRERDWLGYMSELASDEKLREAMGAAAREMASQHLIEDHWQDWAAAYGGLFPARS